MMGKENGREIAEELLTSGKAERKLREIIAAQGGNPEIQPNDVPVGKFCDVVRSDRAGKVLWLSTDDLVRIAREAGTPKEKGAGVVLRAKLGDTVRKDGVLFEIYADRSSKLASALELAKKLSPIVLSKKPEERMVLDQVPEKLTREKPFSLDR